MYLSAAQPARLASCQLTGWLSFTALLHLTWLLGNRNYAEVILNVILNLAGVAFAITAIVFYSIYISHLRLWRDCHFSRSYNKFYYTTAPPSDLESEFFRQVCLEGIYVFKVILIGLNVLLIILSILELCVVITSVLIGIKALRNSGKEESRSTDDPEYNKPLLGEVAIHPTA
ncbi:hypothetical protein AMECASPLE_018348 [Ameca splendens]|uniref:Uncharacterized protein n=1 Tax=Ameca splendens TaxID=208324 RepID=A0ABV0YQ23_9TELE